MIQSYKDTKLPFRLIHCEINYTQVTSRCWIQSAVTDSSSRKTTKRNKQALSKLFDDEIVSVTRSKASCLGSYAPLTTFDLEPLDLQIVALPSNQVILAEPSILRLLGYMTFYP